VELLLLPDSSSAGTSKSLQAVLSANLDSQVPQGKSRVHRPGGGRAAVASDDLQGRHHHAGEKPSQEMKRWRRRLNTRIAFATIDHRMGDSAPEKPAQEVP
jgi:hypothetical protein